MNQSTSAIARSPRLLVSGQSRVFHSLDGVRRAAVAQRLAAFV
ncbi:MAG: hypothetical protein ACK54T_09320 [bacterium]